MSTAQQLPHTPLAKPGSSPAARHDTKPALSSDLHRANQEANAAQIAYFRAIPWCAAHLSPPPGYRDAKLVIAQPLTRRLSATSEHSLISRVLNNPRAIPAYIIFYTAPPQSPTPTSSAPRPSPIQETHPGLIREVGALVALGPQLSSWAGVCHGGVVATLLDDAMAQIMVLNNESGVFATGGVPVVTSRLETRFLKPVRTGTAAQGANVVLVTARLVRVEGRKCLLEAEIKGEAGEVLARGESVFVALGGKL
ncbi:hypothetical protein N658DRAFT_508995 [Parathielavia hyrcaniae]|uniref:Thioesterase domain-containing protein n=1 Tax=Parathielavia hyrcaniae TaxID=113614 RepID=A0AAN6PZW2_9PEZI|nr:hypothetical protein N658DRAFT_508995 [Parathielavia hyrcaniae]